MSSGRGRGYSGRHRETRPGAAAAPDDDHAARLLAELSPRATDTKSERCDRDDRSDTSKPEYQISGDDDAVMKELLTVDDQYASLLVLLEQFSPGEDGIQFNRKLRQFESTVTAMCPDEARLQQAFASFRSAALLRASTARRLATVGACFTRQQRQQPLRAALLNVVMQGTFAKLDVLERVNPMFLINAANLMGDYFAEARLCNGNKVHILAAPLLRYLRALLACNELRAHRSLATQLMQNGRELLSVLPQELDDLSISIRLRLLTPPSVSIIWLLLSADLCLNKFLPLPNTLQQFYAAHLELSSDDSFSEVNYGSWKSTDTDRDRERETEKILNVSQLSLSTDEDGKPKLRPILGAGAGLLRQEQATVGDTFDTWTNKNDFPVKNEYNNDFTKEYSKTSLSKRYDLNSWRQNEEEKEELFNPNVLPPNMQYTTVPEYPPPNMNMRYQNYENVPKNYENTPKNYENAPINYENTPINYENTPINYENTPKNYDNMPNYLQQGDGAYIQNQYSSNVNVSSQGDYNHQDKAEDKLFSEQTQRDTQQFMERSVPEKVNNEVQKSSRRPAVENWRSDKGDLNDESNRNRPRNFPRQRSKESLTEDGETKDIPDVYKPRLSRQSERSRRNSHDLTGNSRHSHDSAGNSRHSHDSTGNTGNARTRIKTPPRRHVTEVPRNHKYWDHDDRCDRDYVS